MSVGARRSSPVHQHQATPPAGSQRCPVGTPLTGRAGRLRNGAWIEPSCRSPAAANDTQKGPADWFTGDVYIDAVAAPEATSTFAAAAVHFTPGARTAWHTHPHGQTIYVTEGVGRCQREGGPIEEIRPGDRVFFEPGENHWHGAAPNRFMVHIAMQQNDDSGSPVDLGRARHRRAVHRLHRPR